MGDLYLYYGLCITRQCSINDLQVLQSELRSGMQSSPDYETWNETWQYYLGNRTLSPDESYPDLPLTYLFTELYNKTILMAPLEYGQVVASFRNGFDSLFVFFIVYLCLVMLGALYGSYQGIQNKRAKKALEKAKEDGSDAGR